MIILIMLSQICIYTVVGLFIINVSKLLYQNYKKNGIACTFSYAFSIIFIALTVYLGLLSMISGMGNIQKQNYHFDFRWIITAIIGIGFVMLGKFFDTIHMKKLQGNDTVKE